MERVIGNTRVANAAGAGWLQWPILALLVAITGAAAAYLIVRDDIAAYRMVGKFESVQIGDDYGDVAAKIGPGREVDIKHIPAINSFQSRRHQHEPSQIVPIVEGYKIYFWESWGCEFYVAFDEDGKVIDSQILDSNSL